MQKGRQPAGTKIVEARPCRRDRDPRHLLVQASDMRLNSTSRFSGTSPIPSSIKRTRKAILVVLLHPRTQTRAVTTLRNSESDEVDDPAIGDDDPLVVDCVRACIEHFLPVPTEGVGTNNVRPPGKHRSPGSRPCGLAKRFDVAAVETARAKNTHVDPARSRARKPHPEAWARVLPVIIASSPSSA
jgi:hypothetical protein